MKNTCSNTASGDLVYRFSKLLKKNTGIDPLKYMNMKEKKETV